MGDNFHRNISNLNEPHISTLDKWHPVFREFAPELKSLSSSMVSIISEYRNNLLQSQNAPSEEDINNHLWNEVVSWLDEQITEPLNSICSSPILNSEVSIIHPHSNSSEKEHSIPNFEPDVLVAR